MLLPVYSSQLNLLWLLFHCAIQAYSSPINTIDFTLQRFYVFMDFMFPGSKDIAKQVQFLLSHLAYGAKLAGFIVIVELELFGLETGYTGFNRRGYIVRGAYMPQVDTTHFLHEAISAADFEGKMW